MEEFRNGDYREGDYHRTDVFRSTATIVRSIWSFDEKCVSTGAVNVSAWTLTRAFRWTNATRLYRVKQVRPLIRSESQVT